MTKKKYSTEEEKREAKNASWRNWVAFSTKNLRKRETQKKKAYAANKESVKDKGRANYARRKEAATAQKREYRQKNLAKLRKREQIYNRENSSARKAARQKWRKENPEKYKLSIAKDLAALAERIKKDPGHLEVLRARKRIHPKDRKTAVRGLVPKKLQVARTAQLKRALKSGRASPWPQRIVVVGNSVGKTEFY